MDDNVYLILPGCDDTNRGDQALIWVTVDLAKKAGYNGKYKMLSNSSQCQQSTEEGIAHIDYVLEHPSTRYQGTQNIEYTLLLKLKWACIAIWDVVSKELLVHPFWRKLYLPFCRSKTKSSIAAFESASACFVKGGGFLHAHGSISDIYKIYYFLYHIRLALSLGKEVFVMPNSFGPFKSPFTKQMVRSTLKKCKLVMARESISANMLQTSCNISPLVFSDLAFHLKGDSSFNAQEVLRKNNIPIGFQKCVAITARPYRFPGEPCAAEKYNNYKNSLVQLTIWLSAHGFYPVFVEHVFSEMDHENDMTCIREICNILQDQCTYSVFLSRDLNCRQMKQVYAAFDYTVGTRFHSVIFSLASRTPSIAITYGGNKGEGIMKDWGLENYALPIQTVTADALIHTFQDLDRCKNSVLETLEHKMDLLSEQEQQIISILRR